MNLINTDIKPDPFDPQTGDVYEFGAPFVQRLVIEDAPSNEDPRVRYRIDGGTDSNLTSVAQFHRHLAGLTDLRGIGRVRECSPLKPDEVVRLMQVLKATALGVDKVTGDLMREAAYAIAEMSAMLRTIHDTLQANSPHEGATILEMLTDSDLTWEARFNNGQGGASIYLGGHTAFVSGKQAHDLAEALYPRRTQVQGMRDDIDAWFRWAIGNIDDVSLATASGERLRKNLQDQLDRVRGRLVQANGEDSMSTILDDGKAARDIAARTPEADNDYESEVHAAACWLEAEGQGDALYLTHYSTGTTLWRTAAGSTPIRCKVDWLQRTQETAAKRLAEAHAKVEAPDPEMRAAIHDRLFGEEGES